MKRRKPTSEQRVHLSRRGERYGTALSAELWLDYDKAEAFCNKSPRWREYRSIRPASQDQWLT